MRIGFLGGYAVGRLHGIRRAEHRSPQVQQYPRVDQRRLHHLLQGHVAEPGVREVPLGVRGVANLPRRRRVEQGLVTGGGRGRIFDLRGHHLVMGHVGRRVVADLRCRAPQEEKQNRPQAPADRGYMVPERWHLIENRQCSSRCSKHSSSTRVAGIRWHWFCLQGLALGSGFQAQEVQTFLRVPSAQPASPGYRKIPLRKNR